MFALRRAKLEISSIPLSEVDLSFQCHCLPTQQPPFHFETHYHKCEDFYWLVSFFITGSNLTASNLLILSPKVIWKYTLALVLYHSEILLLFGCIHNDRLSKSRSGVSFISYMDFYLCYWIKNVQREYENIISYLPLLASSPQDSDLMHYQWETAICCSQQSVCKMTATFCTRQVLLNLHETSGLNILFHLSPKIDLCLLY